jgi:hypothetical protein
MKIGLLSEPSNAPREILLRAAFLFGLCFLATEIVCTYLGGIYLLASIYAASPLCDPGFNRISLLAATGLPVAIGYWQYGNAHLEFERILATLDSIAGSSDGNVSDSRSDAWRLAQILDQIGATSDTWERHTLQQRAASILVGKPELIEEFEGRLDYRTTLLVRGGQVR